MANATLSFSQTNMTGYLLVIARKGNDMANIDQSMVFPPPHPASRNFVMSNLEATVYYFEFRQSPDGVQPGILLNQLFYDVKNDIPISEIRRYRADGPLSTDPASGQTDIVDPYLDGKTIDSFFKEGFRDLIPGEEYQTLPGGGVRLIGTGGTFSPGEVATLRIIYLIKQPAAAGGVALNLKTVTDSRTLDSTYNNADIILATPSDLRQKVTMHDVTTMPDKTTFVFNTYDGAQINSIIEAAPNNLFRFNNDDVPYIILGRDEWVEMRKTGGVLRVTKAHPGLTQVGERFNARHRNHINTLAENDELYDGYDYARIWDWVVNVLEPQNKITVPIGSIIGYTRELAKMGCFIIATDGTQRKFRMPNQQNYAERALKDVNHPGTDGQRLYDHAGGVQEEMVGSHYHATGVQPNASNSGGGDPKFNRADNADPNGELHPVRRWNAANGVDANQASSTDLNRVPDGSAYTTENRVANIGYIPLTRI